MTDDVGYSGDSSCTSNSLLERAKRNDSDAWQVLVELYAPVVYTRRRKNWSLSAPAAADDVGQEVFTAVARKLVHFQRQRTGSFRKWLRTITDNKCKDLLSKHPLATAAGGSAALKAIENLREQDESNDSRSAKINENAILMKQALKAVENEFSDRDVETFWSVAVEERCRQEIAAEWHVTDNVVYPAYSRIRKRLCDIFQELLDLDVAGESVQPG